MRIATRFDIRMPAKAGWAAALVLVIGLAGCAGKEQSVQLMPEVSEPMACSEALETDTHGIPDDQFFRILNSSESGDWLETCWTPLVIKALEEGREIPMAHLTRAIHRFNRRETKHAFNLAAFQYFSRMSKGEIAYGNAQKALLAEYVHLAIREARHKNDTALKQAMVVCSRLDTEMYDKFFN